MPSSQRIRASLSALIVLTVSAQGAQKSSNSDAASPKPKQDIEFASPELATLDLFVGSWRVIENHFNTRGERVATVKGSEEIAWVLDNRAIQRTYTTTASASVFRAIGLLTWNESGKKFQGTWFDNNSTTGPTAVRGEWLPGSRTMEFTIESRDKSGSPVQYKVVERLLGLERRVATTYLVQGGKVIKRMEVEYERTIPCPDRIRVIYGEDLLGINK